MTSLREWKRELRLLLIVSEIADHGTADVVDVLAADFLLQHPSLLPSFAARGAASLPIDADVPASEVHSSEEAFLRWKRSVGDQAVAPMLGRLFARSLLTREGETGVRLTSAGKSLIANREQMLRSKDRSRLTFVVEQSRIGRAVTLERLRGALAEAAS